MDYKEKLRLAKEALESGSYDKETIEYIFPELKESEDEKIFEEIYKDLHTYYMMQRDKFVLTDAKEIWDDKWSKAKAWLEKQCTPAKLSEEEQNKFAKGVLTSCALSFIDYLDAHKYEDKMCVSNGECEDIENAFHNAMWDRLHRYYCKYIEKQDEQKSAWSEEDDKILKSIIINIENLQFSEDMREKYHHILNANKSYYQIKIDWLKSLKNKVQPQPKQVLDFLDKLRTPKDRVQPKQEWSGGDEAHLHSLIIHLEQWIERHPNTTGADIQGENVAWLKSLKLKLKD